MKNGWKLVPEAMNKLSADYRNAWWTRIQNERRQYFFQKFGNKEKLGKRDLMQVFRWIADDIRYIKKWGVNILLQLRTYGPIIQKKYGLSKWTQFWRMAYLTFYHQVDPKSIRGRRLYLPESWKYVDDYTYKHDESQYFLAERSFPKEISIFENKFEFLKSCQSNNIATPEILAIFENGSMSFSVDSSFSLPRQNLFIKYLTGKAGLGINKMKWFSGKFSDYNGNEFTPEELSVRLAEESKRSGIILQDVVNNHSSWAGYTSGALATCRIVTAKSPDDGSVIPLFAALRIPVGDALIDNFSKGGFYSGIDLETGKLSAASGLKSVNGSFDFIHHPDTGQKIEGEMLPFWHEILDFTLRTHSKFSTIFVGWDISMTQNGPTVVEGNIGWASRSYECPNMRPLRETEYPILYEKWMKKMFKAK